MTDERTGDQLLQMLSALANPHRLRILAALSARQAYVSELARELGISRPLLHMHLQTLQKAGLVGRAPRGVRRRQGAALLRGRGLRRAAHAQTRDRGGKQPEPR